MNAHHDTSHTVSIFYIVPSYVSSELKFNGEPYDSRKLFYEITQPAKASGQLKDCYILERPIDLPTSDCQVQLMFHLVSGSFVSPPKDPTATSTALLPVSRQDKYVFYFLSQDSGLLKEAPNSLIQLAGLAAYVNSVSASEVRFSMLSALARSFSWNSRGSVFPPEVVVEFYELVKGNFAEGDARKFCAGLILLGAFKSIYEDSYSFWDERTDGRIVKAELELWKLMAKSLPLMPNNCFSEAKTEETGREFAIRGFSCGFGYLTRMKCGDEVLDYLCRKLSDQSVFQEIANTYFAILESIREKEGPKSGIIISEETYQGLELTMKGLGKQSEAGLLRAKLLRFAHSLPFFLERLIEFYKGRTEEPHFARDIGEHIDIFMLYSTLPYTDILSAMQKSFTAKLPGPLKEAIFKSPVLISGISKRFQPGAEIKETDLATIKQIFDQQQGNKVVSMLALSWEQLESLLLPLVNSPQISFAELVKTVVLPVGMEFVNKFLKERVRLRLRAFDKEALISELSKELEMLMKSMRNLPILEQYMFYALEMLKDTYKDYVQIMDLVLCFQYIHVETMCNKAICWVYENVVLPELSASNFAPVRVAGELLSKCQVNKCVGLLFSQICGYFDGECVKNYVPQALVTQFMEELYLVLKLGAPETTKNTRNAIAEFWAELQRREITVSTAREIANMKDSGRDKIADAILCFFASERIPVSSPVKKADILAEFSGAIKMLKESEETTKMFRDLAVEITLLNSAEKEAFERLVQNYGENETGRTLVEYATLPKELQAVKEPLEQYYKVRDLDSVNYFVKKAFAKYPDAGLGDFGKVFIPALEKSKKTLRSLLDSIETFRMAKLAKMFDGCKNGFEKREINELAVLLSLTGAESRDLELKFFKAFDALRQAQQLYKDIKDVIALKDVVFLHDNDLYFFLGKYREVCENNFGERSIKDVTEIISVTQRQLNSSLGKGRSDLLKIFSVLSKGVGLIKLLLSLEVERLEKLKESVIDYDDINIRRSSFNIFQDLRAFADSCNRAQSKEEVLVFCLRLYSVKEKWASLEGVLEQGDTYAAEVWQLCKRTEATSVLRMENIDEILLKSELMFKHDPAGWRLFLSFSRKDAKKTCEFDYFLLQELSERAFLYRTVQAQAVGRKNMICRKDSSAEVITLEKYDTYLELTKSVSGILEILEKLAEMSYPDLEPSYSLTLEKGLLSQSVKPFLQHYGEVYADWDKGLRAAYEDFSVLTYWLPSQFWIVEDFLRSPESFRDKSTAHSLFQYAGINIDCIPLTEPYNKSRKADPIDRLYYLGERVQKFVVAIPSEVPLVPCYTCAVITDNLLLGVYNLYKEFHCQFPKLNQLLFCSGETKWESVLCFLYRCLGNSADLHIILCVERLAYGLQNKMVQLIDSLSPQILNACLGFVSAQGESVVLKHLQAIDMLSIIVPVSYKWAEIFNTLGAAFPETHKNSHVVMSVMAGMGKSNHVAREAKHFKFRVRSLTLYGELAFAEVGERLAKLAETWKYDNDALCLKVYRVNNPGLLDSLLLQVLLYRCVQYDSKLIYLPRSSRIYVEIANTYKEQLRASLSTHQYFQRGIVKVLANLNCLDEESTYLKHLINYLKLIESGSLENTTVDILHLSPVTLDECTDLMKKYFFSVVESGQVTLLQVSVFLRFVSKMLENFEGSVFTPDLLVQNCVPVGENIRSRIVLKLVESCIQLTKNSIQSTSDIDATENFTEAASAEVNPEFIKKIIETIKPFRERKLMGLCFSEQGQLIPLNYRSHKDKELLETILKVQRAVVKRAGDSLNKSFVCDSFMKRELFGADYEKMTHPDFVEILKQIFNLEKLDTHDYVLTFDNYYKMLYIYLRAISNIPVILMGDTGCGKTRMMKFISEQLLGATLKVFNIHAGVTRQEIIEYVLSVQHEAESHPARKLWLFFDEFNTNENIGLLTEIVCDRMMDGVVLAKNILFVAACNPYRLKTGKTLCDENAGLSKDFIQQSERRIMYRVYQLPKTIIEYVWDFGPLKDCDEKEYISAILGDAETYPKGLKEKMMKLIVVSHRFFKENDDSHIVSLRDLQRYKKLYHWFSTSHRREPETSAILALIFCYYYCISFEEKRSMYLCTISAVWKGGCNVTSLKSLLEAEAEYFTQTMALPENVVWNDSLRECIFAMIICIMTKIPLLVVGKPGCSKTLAMQILAAHFKGASSLHPFFRNYPEVVLFYYQGSLTCDSSEIEKVFDRAKGALEESTVKRQLLPVVVIDEIGLCELSPRNPLKVLHKRLEIEALEIGFIGISNWRLDEAKMNRVLYLTRLPPEAGELIKTAQAMYDKFNPHMREPLMDKVALACKEFQSQFDSYSVDVFGLRDYYALLRQLAQSLPNCRSLTQKCNEIRTAMKRNFDKMPSAQATRSLWKKFIASMGVGLGAAEGLSNLDDKLSMIARSLDTLKDRYVMLVGKSSVVSNLAKIAFPAEMDGMRIIIGSELEKDVGDKEYNSRLLCQIEFCVETGFPIVLKKLKGTYGSLYDLFNQYCGSRSCRIAIGSAFHPACPIHKSFHCVVIMDQNEFEHENTPLLNRFEKHGINIDKLMSPGEEECLARIKDWLNLFVRHEKGQSSISLHHLFANLDSNFDLVKILVFSESRRTKKSIDSIIASCKDYLLKLATMDLLVSISVTIATEDKRNAVLDAYKAQHQTSLKSDLKECAGERRGVRLLYFTYADQPFEPEKVFADLAGRVLLLNLSLIKSEEVLVQQLLRFFTSTESRLLLCLVDVHSEAKHVEHLHSLVVRYEEYDKSHEKNVCVLMFMKRSLIGKREEMVYIDGYEMKMYDGMEQNAECMIGQLNKQIKSIILDEIESSFDRFFSTWLNKVCTRISREDPSGKRRNVWGHIVELAAKDPELIRCFKNKVKSAIDSSKEAGEELSNRLQGGSTLAYKNIQDAISKIAGEAIESYLFIIVYTVEKYSAFRAYFAEKRPDQREKIRDIWFRIFGKLNFNWRMQIAEFARGMKVRYCSGLRFPFSLFVYESVEGASDKGNSASLQSKIAQTFSGLFAEELNDALRVQILMDLLKIALHRHVPACGKEIIQYMSGLLIPEGAPHYQRHNQSVVEFLYFLFARSALLKSAVQLLQIGSRFLPLIKLAEPGIVAKPDPAGKSDDNFFEKLLRAKAIAILELLIENVGPTAELLKSFKNSIGHYSAQLLKIRILCFNIAGTTQNLRHKDYLTFWLDLSRYMAKTSETSKMLIEKYNQLASSAAGKSLPETLVSDDFLDETIDEIERLEDMSVDNAPMITMKAAIYRIAVGQRSVGLFEKLLNEFKDPKLCRAYAKLVKDIAERAELANLSVAKGRIQLPKNLLVTKIDAYLATNGVTCNFGVMLFYYLKKRNKKFEELVVLKDETFEGSLAGYLTTAANEAEKSPLTKLLACLCVRFYVETYYSFCIRKDNPVAKSKFKAMTSTCLNSSNPVSATARFFLLKKARKEGSGTFNLSALMSKHCSIESLSENPHIILLTDPDMYEKYGEISCLVRHLKTCNIIHDDLAFKKLMSVLTSPGSKDFATLLPLVLTFVNEFYPLSSAPHSSPAFSLCETMRRTLMSEPACERIKSALGEGIQEFCLDLLSNFYGQSRLLSSCANASADEAKGEEISLQQECPRLNGLVAAVVAVFVSARTLVNPFTSCFCNPKLPRKETAGIIQASYLFGMPEGKGYHKHVPENPPETVRQISGVTFRVLHLFLHCILYYLNQKNDTYGTAGLIGPSPEEAGVYLTLHIVEDVKGVADKFQISADSACEMLELVVTKFAAFLPNAMQSTSASTPEKREEFESQFEKYVFSSLISNREYRMKDYQESLAKYRDSPYYFTSLQLFDYAKKDPHSLYVEFFKVHDLPTYANMYEVYKATHSDKQFPLASLLMEHSELEMRRIKQLAPIVQFTNHVLESFDYKVPKAKMAEIKLDFAGDRQLNDLLNDFRTAWRETGSRTVLGQSADVKDYLLDAETEEGKLLIEEIKELGNLQNTVLKAFRDKVNHSLLALEETQTDSGIIEERTYAVQSIGREDVIDLRVEYNLIAQEQSCYSEAYLGSTVVYYDYGATENFLMTKLLDKKLLDCDKLDTVHYQGEINTDESILELVRAKVPQKEISKQELSILKKRCPMLMTSKSYEGCKEIFNALEAVLYRINSAGEAISAELSIPEYCQKEFGATSHISEGLNCLEQLGSYPIGNLVDLYENLELEFYEVLAQTVPEKFSERDDNVKLLMVEYINNMAGLVERFPEEFFKVVKRFVLRYAKPELNPQSLLSEKLFMNCLWSVSMREQLGLFKAKFPARITAGLLMTVHAEVEAVVLRKAEKSLSSSGRNSMLSSDHDQAPNADDGLGDFSQ